MTGYEVISSLKILNIIWWIQYDLYRLDKNNSIRENKNKYASYLNI